MGNRRIWIVAGTVAVVVIAAGFSIWWFLLRSDAPEAVTLEGAVASVTSTTGGSDTGAGTGAGGSTTTAASETAGSATTTAPAAPGIDGSWALAGDGRSFAGYRVEEELARIGVTTAVGRSDEVSGSITIEGGAVAVVEVVVDMTALESDDSRRDGAIRRQALETEAFPEASFRSTEPIPLPAGAASGEAFAVAATGDLTLHGVTRTVTIPLEAQFVEGTIVVVGSLDVLFSDYDIDPPSAAIVLSVDEQGIMEFQLVFERP